MKEHPILFSAPMVCALLEGRKTQTRRVVKPQPETTRIRCFKGAEWWDGDDNQFNCPYGQPGDRLWCRETWASRGNNPVARPDGKFGAAVIEYRADGQRTTWCHDPIQRDADGYWRPSIFLPRWASRITLEITEVRVQRLQEISEEDAITEGIPTDVDSIRAANYKPVKAYRSLWESINGPGSWAANPWVWAITFKRITR